MNAPHGVCSAGRISNKMTNSLCISVVNGGRRRLLHPFLLSSRHFFPPGSGSRSRRAKSTRIHGDPDLDVKDCKQ
jgi:hypothetical protein